MLAKLRPRSAYDVMAALALFVAVSTGGAYAASTIGSTDVIDESLLSQDIKNGEVKNSEIGSDQVTTGKIRSGNVLTSDLASGGVTNIKLGAGAVDASKVADNSLTGTDIGDGTLGGVDIANGAVSNGKIADGAIDGAKVANDSLDGFDIQNLDGASIQEPEGWHQIGAPGEPGFENGWQPGGRFAGDVGPGFYYDPVTRRVHLRGKMNGGNNQCAFRLPPDRAPAAYSSYLAYLGSSFTDATADFVLVTVNPGWATILGGAGAVCVNRNGIGTGNPVNPIHISLDGISFRVG